MTSPSNVAISPRAAHIIIKALTQWQERESAQRRSMVVEMPTPRGGVLHSVVSSEEIKELALSIECLLIKDRNTDDSNSTA